MFDDIDSLINSGNNKGVVSSSEEDLLLEKLNFKCDSVLFNKIKDFINSRSNKNDEHHIESFSQFARDSLYWYDNNREKEFTYTLEKRNKKRSEAGFTFTDKDRNIYLSLPKKSRREMIQKIMGSYLNKLEKDLQKVKK